MSTKSAPPAPASATWSAVISDFPAGSPTPFRAQVLPASAAILAAWLAAGSTGLLGHPLRHALTCLALLTALVAGWPAARPPILRIAILVAAAIAGLFMTSSSVATINVLAPLVVFGGLTLLAPPSRLFTSVLRALAVFALYRLANATIPILWQLTDAFAGLLASAAGALAGKPLATGATFGGLDYLVLMAALASDFLPAAAAPRSARTAYTLAAILVGHFLYLAALAWTPALADFLTAPVNADTSAITAYLRGLSIWKQILPWNVPLLAAAIHTTIAAVLFRAVPLPPPATFYPQTARWITRLASALALLAAFTVPITTCLYPAAPSLQHKKIVAYEKGFLNWLKPEHGEYGRLSIGMYGNFGTFVESLGGSFVKSPDLSPDDLKDADLVVLFFPTSKLTDEQLQRVHAYVRRGGSLLLLADHTTREPLDKDPFITRDSRFNDVLAPTHMRVPFDTAVFAVGGWLQSYDPIAHPTTLGIDDDRNTFGVVIGSSVKAPYPASPILMGRWGLIDRGDPGSGPAMLGNDGPDPGEKIGDVVLIAEERLENGRILVFGDTSSFVNGININSYPFTARILSYLSDHRSPAPGLARQCLAALGLLILAGFSLRFAGRAQLTALALLLAFMLALCIHRTSVAAQLLPDGHCKSPNNVALIDTAHLGAFSEESTRQEGTFGIEYTLMRNGYLVLAAPEITPERLRCAGLLLSIAPGRAYSRPERRAIYEFVDNGGIFILTAGCERAAPSRTIMADFGFTIGAPLPTQPLDTEPAPFGHFKSPYLENGPNKAHVRFWAGWPIGCTGPDKTIIANGAGDIPIIIVRQVGKGKVVLIGDSEFALNKNLEHEDGSPFEGVRENADFWRWFLANLRGLPPWTPPSLDAPTSTPASLPGNSPFGPATAPAAIPPALPEAKP